MITLSDLQHIMPNAGVRAELFIQPLNDSMDEFEINTPKRRAPFLAQCAHESGELRYVRELWGPSPTQAAYEGRADLGNIHPGDGKKFLGRGLIQVTGRTNTLNCSLVLFGDDRLLEHPEILEQPVEAARSAGWFWHTHDLNKYADTGRFDVVTRRINGLYKDLRKGDRERYGYYEAACAVFGLTDAEGIA